MLSKKIVLLPILLLLAVILNYFFVQSAYTATALDKITPSSDYTIVFFGTTPSINGLQNHYFQNRLTKVLELHRRLPKSKVLISGYHSKYYSELDATKDKLIENQIDPQQIELHYANDTFDTIRYISNLFKNNPDQQVVLVSQKFHLQRASFIARYFHTPTIQLEAPSVDLKLSSSFILIREVFARLKVYYDILKFKIS